MGITYKPLWKLLIDRDMQKKELARLSKVSISTIAKMGRNEYVALEILERICKVLDCGLADVLEFTDSGKKEE